MKIINFIAGSCLFLVACTTEHVIDVRYEKQKIPQDLLECPEKPICTAIMQSDVAKCILEYDALVDQCKGRLTAIKEVTK